MRTKKYTASSIPEAMKKVRAELGDDAVILNSRVITTKKFFGLVKKRDFEVVAGVDDIVAKEQTKAPDFAAFTMAEPTPVQAIDDVEAKRHAEELKRELADLKTLMKTVQQQTTQSQYPDELLPFIEYLKRQELSEELITKISDGLFAHIKMKEDIDFYMFENTVRGVLKEELGKLPFGGLSYNKKYVHVLGPTGVGKTTTIAKMAARAVLEKKQKVGFITTDTYRIAAIEQLKTYAGLLQAPVEIVYNADDYAKAIAQFAHLDLVFVDTAGRNYKEGKYVEDLQQLITFGDDAESFLVLTTTAKESDMVAVIEKFADIPIEKFIFTKVDETNSVGTIINLMVKYKKGLAYYTNGQEVPEDIEEAELEKLLDLFFKGDVI